MGSHTQLDITHVGGGESGYIAVRPDNPDIVFAGNYKGQITRHDQSTGETRPILVWPEETSTAGEGRYRFNWTAPIMLSPHDPGILYQAGNHVFRSIDEGQTWEPISPRLSYADQEKLGPSGELTPDNSGAEYYCTVFALASRRSRRVSSGRDRRRPDPPDPRRRRFLDRDHPARPAPLGRRCA